MINATAVERFLDTNIPLSGYDLDAAQKRVVAQSLMEEAWNRPGRTAISVQVMQEFHVNFIRKGHSTTKSALILRDLFLWPVIDNTLAVFQMGLSLQTRWQVSLWDAMILAAAQTSGAKELFTEDPNYGQDYGGVRVVNPFLAA